MGKVKNIAIGIEENTTSLHDNNHNVLGFSCDDIEFLKNYLKEWRLVQTHARFKYGSQDNVYRPLPGAFKNKKLAETILNEEKQDDARLALASSRVLSRELSDREQTIWKRTLERSTKEFTADPGAANAYLSHGDSKPDGQLKSVELAAWTALCLNMLNLDETLNKE